MGSTHGRERARVLCQGRTEMKFEDMLDPKKRDQVIAAYNEAGLGRERYGVVCPNCKKRIAPQGIHTAMKYPDNYCQCTEQYNYEQHEDIYQILEQHGLDPTIGNRLKPQPFMHEATNKSRRKRNKKRNDNSPRKAPPKGPTFLKLLAKQRRNNAT
jgi:hypothetical protein